MRGLRIVTAAAGAAALVLAGAFAWIALGYAPVAADVAPSPLEASLAMTAVHAAAQRETGTLHDPLPTTAANLAAGLALYQQECVMCHGAADGRPSAIARGLYVPAPQFAVDGVEDDSDGATFWKVRRGIRFTAMPAFGRTLSEAQIWRVTMFVRHMDRLPGVLASRWSTTRSVGATSR